MANLDTEDKRRTAANFFLHTINPVADGTIGQHDRVQASGVYGFNVESVAPGGVVPQLFWLRRNL